MSKYDIAYAQQTRNYYGSITGNGNSGTEIETHKFRRKKDGEQKFVSSQIYDL